MVSRILVISVVPEGPLAALVADLKARYPSASITALVGAEPTGAASRASAEFLLWGSLPARRLIGELRGRRFDRAVVAHGGDQCLSRSYWKAVAVALLCGGRRAVLCEDGKLTRSAPAAGAGGRAAVQLAGEAYVACVGLMLLGVVLLGVVLVEVTEGLAGGRRQSGRTAGRLGER